MELGVLDGICGTVSLGYYEDFVSDVGVDMSLYGYRRCKVSF
jgi:hypothetical protein